MMEIEHEARTKTTRDEYKKSFLPHPQNTHTLYSRDKIEGIPTSSNYPRLHGLAPENCYGVCFCTASIKIRENSSTKENYWLCTPSLLIFVETFKKPWDTL